MRVDFKDKALLELYEQGESHNKDIRKLSLSVKKAFFKVIQAFEISYDLEEFKHNNKGAHYERLSGKLANYESVRLNKKYRLEFQSSAEEKEVIITKIYVIKISNHYK